MKSAYELAMERLNKTSPSLQLSAAQKKALAELDSKYAAKIAEREIACKGDRDRLAEAGEAEKAEQLQQRWVQERKALQTELEERKDRVRTAKP